MKTPSVSEVFKPLNRLIAEAREQFEKEQQSHEAAQAVTRRKRRYFKPRSKTAERKAGNHAGCLPRTAKATHRTAVHDQ
jgi:hypothetical protein